MNVATTAILNTAATPRHNSDDVETHIKSLEDMLLSKIAALNSYFSQTTHKLTNRFLKTETNIKKLYIQFLNIILTY